MAKLSKTYNPSTIEDKIYEWWESSGFFKPEKMEELGIVNESSSTFCNTIPPPNITGYLHLGHAITIALQDLMVRYHRMLGDRTLFVPGVDHAGIATQNVVERELNKQGIQRKDIGREKFLEHVWAWKEKSLRVINKQSKKLGLSSDWDREAFTMSDELSRAVRKAFVTLYRRDLIYRGNYLVNWCPGRCESAISNLEAEPEEVNSYLWYIKYPVITDSWKGPQGEWGSSKWADGAKDFIEVATTRPETLLGDSAIAIRKDHIKYGKYLGFEAVIPVLGRKVKIIHDDEVDPQFGTGAVKVTPAHDFNDEIMGNRHNLDFIKIFDLKAIIVEEYGGKYKGMNRFEARETLVKDLEKEGLLIKTEKYTHSLPHCQRCHTVIEPMPSLQWFVRTKPLSEKVLSKIDSHGLKVIPQNQMDRLKYWLNPETIRDWCISRQLWWGHRIPIWYCQDCDAISTGTEDPTECSSCNGTNLEQDPDVLDTWFSSALWPFSTLGWPDKTKDMDHFYPNDLRETGYDILFFWVARELWMGAELTNQLPYKNVYFHGLVRNEEGRKISKSMENIDDYDPLKQIADHGADSLRYTLIAYSSPGLDMNLDPNNIENAQKWGNKLWQMTRFVLVNISNDFEFKSVSPENLEFTDKWILSRYNSLIKEVSRYYSEYNFLDAAREIRRFAWNVFADWYIEISKIRLYNESNNSIDPRNILLTVIEGIFRLLHPIMPFITEELWQALPETVKPNNSDALIIAPWPESQEKFIDEKLEQRFEVLMNVIVAIRRIRGEFSVAPSRKIKVILSAGINADLLKQTKSELCELASIDSNQLKILKNSNPKGKHASTVTHGVSIFIPLEGLVNIDEEVARIEKEIDNIDKQIKKSEGKLNSKFVERAPQEVVEAEQKKVERLKDKQETMVSRKNMLLE